MARQKGGARILGPYFQPARGRWHVVVVGAEGERVDSFFETEREAEEVARAARRRLKAADELTVDGAIDEYEVHMRGEKENKTKSISETVRRLRLFFGDELPCSLRQLDERACLAAYKRLCEAVSERTKKPYSPDTQLNIRAEASSFLRWCADEKRWISANPMAKVKGRGKRRHGKPQLRIDESRRWLRVALQLADEGEEGALAAMMTLLMNMRCSEIVSRIARDVDDEGRVLWISVSKTAAGRRTLEVPGVLVSHLRDLAAGKQPGDLLFGRHWRDWPRHWVKHICEKAGVPKVCAHAMRGAHASLATERGITAHVVAAALGHESETTTFRSYATAESVAAGRQRRLIEVLDLVDNDCPPIVVQTLSDEKRRTKGSRQLPETT